jgi:hypothetical protein
MSRASKKDPKVCPHGLISLNLAKVESVHSSADADRKIRKQTPFHGNNDSGKKFLTYWHSFPAIGTTTATTDWPTNKPRLTEEVSDLLALEPLVPRQVKSF